MNEHAELNQPEVNIVPWKSYLTTTLQSLISFYIATLCLVYFFIHLAGNWLLPAIFMILLYAFVIFACAKLIIQKFSIAALMLIIPIAPFLALTTIISFIPLLEKFK